MSEALAQGLEPLAPRDTAPLFRPLLDELLALLRGLAASDWERPTVAGNWRVRDVAAHLLDGDLRKLAVYRDSHEMPLDTPITSDRDLARFINGLNASGVAYAARLSSRLLTDLLEITGAWVATLVADLPPHGPALFPVSWAGEASSENWMDVGREYTERWHHQAQIRDAVGRPRLLASRWMEPLIEFSVRALPHAFRFVDAPAGTAVTLAVHGDTSGAWTLVRDESTWQIHRGRPGQPAAVAALAADDVWRMFYNALSPVALVERVEITGDRALAELLLLTRSVIM